MMLMIMEITDVLMVKIEMMIYNIMTAIMLVVVTTMNNGDYHDNNDSQ